MFKLKGHRQVTKNLRTVAKKFPRAARSSLLKHGKEILADSKDNYVPVDEGDLKKSGEIRLGEKRGHVISVIIQYGRKRAQGYALAVHEHPSDHSPPTWLGKAIKFKPDGRGPKYLEIPLRNATPFLAEKIAKDLNVENLVDEVSSLSPEAELEELFLNLDND